MNAPFVLFTLRSSQSRTFDEAWANIIREKKESGVIGEANLMVLLELVVSTGYTELATRYTDFTSFCVPLTLPSLYQHLLSTSANFSHVYKLQPKFHFCNFLTLTIESRNVDAICQFVMKHFTSHFRKSLSTSNLYNVVSSRLGLYFIRATEIISEKVHESEEAI
jgi:hypothetical protein